MSREEAIKQLKQIIDVASKMERNEKEIDAFDEEALEMAIKVLEEEQEPKTGHWIQTNEFFINRDGQFIYKFICPECNALSYFRKSNKKAVGANACPNCGAKMEG